MIIAFAGRKGSGKTVLANETIERGFRRISFADKLKEVVAQLYGWTVDSLNDPVSKEQILTHPKKWDYKSCKRLNGLLNTQIDFTEEYKMYSRRQALQYIGTNVIRKISPDFHVDSLINAIEDGQDFVIDDLRFPNEYQALQQRNAICIYVTRPYLRTYSNHLSEISLNRQDFNYVILNDSPLHTLLRKFRMFLDYVLCKKTRVDFTREDLLKLLTKHSFNTNKSAKDWGCSRDKIVWWCSKMIINIPRSFYKYDHDAFSRINEKTAYWAGILSSDGCVKIGKNHTVELTCTDLVLIEGLKKFLKSDKSIYKVKKRKFTRGYKGSASKKQQYQLVVHSPWIMDDLKLWCLEPRKSKINKVPDIIYNEIDSIKSWIVGLIDGDGSIYISKQTGSPSISILASQQIVDFILSTVPVNACKCAEKDIENLYTLKYNGKYAVELYKYIYNGKGLHRKWNIIKPFLNKRWHH